MTPRTSPASAIRTTWKTTGSTTTTPLASMTAPYPKVGILAMPVAHDAIEPELSCSGILKPQYRRRCNRWVHVGKYKCSGCGETLFKWEEGRWSHSNAFRAMEDKQRWARDGGLPLKTCASLDSGS